MRKVTTQLFAVLVATVSIVGCSKTSNPLQPTQLSNAAAGELETRLHETRADKAKLDERASRLGEELQTLSSSVTWRLRARLLAIPGLAGFFRWAASALAGRAGR